MAELRPEDIASRSFRNVFRGFDPDEVRRFLSVVAEFLEELTRERERLSERLSEMSDDDIKVEMEAVGREVGEVLETARQAAAAMRERAAGDAARWRSEVMAETESERRRARADAEHLRGDAWTTADELLNQAQREATKIVDDAGKEALRRVGEAEREAHRIQTHSRREADEVLRNARMEAERLVIEATARRDEIIESAQKQAESAQERTRALEQRRDELKREIDSVKEALAAMEGEMDHRRERLGYSPSTTDAEAGESEAEQHWEPGETVRIIRSQSGTRSETVTPRTDIEEVAVQEVAPKVKVISASELSNWDAKQREAVDQREDVADEEIAEQPQPTDESPEEEDEAAPGQSVAPESDERANGTGFDELAGLFARLKEPEPSETKTGPSVEAETDEAGAPGQEPDPDAVGDVFERRDAVLLPVANEALRDIKKSLTEAQNDALEALRLDHQGWVPDGAGLEDRVREDLTELAEASFRLGCSSVTELLGGEQPLPELTEDVVTSSFSSDLVRELRHVLEEGRAHDQGTRQLSSSVSRVFRAWRTDESERRVRDLSLSAYNMGVARTADAAGLPGMRWLVAGRGCATCRAQGAEQTVKERPPAHPGCECAIVPIQG